MSYLLSGVDLLSLDCINKADVQQAITQATPTSQIGFVIVSDTAPDVAATPELARFIWLESAAGVLTGDFYYYDGTSWQLLLAIDGANLAPGSVTPDKLSVAGGLPYEILQINPGGTEFNYIDIISAISVASVPINKLIGSGAGNFMLVSLSGVNSWATLASIVNYISDNTIPIAKLIKGGTSAHGLFLRTFEDGTIVEWVDFDPNEQIDDGELVIAKISGVGGNAGQSIRRNPANNGWEWFTGALPSNNFVVRANGVATATPLALGDTNIMNFTLALPSSRSWKSFRIAFSTAVDNAVGIVNNFTMRIGADVLTVYATPQGGLQWSSSDPTRQQVMYIAEADVPAGHIIDGSLVLSLYAQSAAPSAGDVIAYRSGFAAAEYY